MAALLASGLWGDMLITMLVLDLRHRQELLDHARRESPRECCGILIGGRSQSQSRATVSQVLPCANASASPENRYLISAVDLLAAQKRARQRESAVLGFYHSHPHSAAFPSVEDLRGAYWAGHSYMIIGPLDGKAEIRSFLLCQEEGPRRAPFRFHFEEEPVLTL
ncbi:MAG: M67 family metallopeptidase [Acidobacteriaceae bacterium]